MQTSRFQLGLVCALSLALGLALDSGDAIGYPSASTVSYNQNPIVSIGGTAYSGEAAKSLFTAPDDQALIITDVILTSTSDMDCKRTHKTEISGSTGAVMAQFETSSVFIEYNGSSRRYPSDGKSISHSYLSGLRVEPGETLLIGTLQTYYTPSPSSTCQPEAMHGVRYSVSGYYAQP